MKIVLTALEGPPGQEIIPVLVDARCATCRWAKRIDFGASHVSRCLKADGLSRAFVLSGRDVDLLVTPDFGCVQWQAQDDPAPETP